MRLGEKFKIVDTITGQFLQHLSLNHTDELLSYILSIHVWREALQFGIQSFCALQFFLAMSAME